MPRRVLTILSVAVTFASVTPSHAAIAVRKDVKDMTAQEKKDFVDAVIKLKHTRSPFGKNKISLYDVFVYYHRRVSNLKRDGAHRGPAFLPWHREFLYAFEAALENVSGKDDLAIPYWNWTDPASTAAVFGEDFMGGNGVAGKHHAVMNGPFRKGRWRIRVAEGAASDNPFEPDVDQVADHPYIQRAFGSSEEHGVKDLPTAAEMERVLAVTEYDSKPWNKNSDPRFSFRCALEGWGRPDAVDDRGAHNQVHLWVGGEWKERGGTQLGTISGAASPNDPVFWLIHSNIDRLWTGWEADHGFQYEPEKGAGLGHNLRDPLSQFAELGLGITDEDLSSGKTLRPIDLLDPAPLQVEYQAPLR
jgi:tyrosinase